MMNLSECIESLKCYGVNPVAVSNYKQGYLIFRVDNAELDSNLFLFNPKDGTFGKCYFAFDPEGFSAALDKEKKL